MPTEDPFESTAADAHDTGNFVTLSLEEANSGDYDNVANILGDEVMQYINRVEYTEENHPTYIETEDGDVDSEQGETLSSPRVDVGRQRLGGIEYFYALYWNDADGTDATDEWLLRIGQTPHTTDYLGTTDFSDAGEEYAEFSTVGTDEEAAEYTEGDVSYISSVELVTFDETSLDSGDEGTMLDADANAVGENEELRDQVADDEVREYNLYVNGDSSTDVARTIRARYNTDLQGPEEDWATESIASGQSAIINGQTGDDALNPGQNFPVDIGVEVPLGVDTEGVDTGTLTLIADTAS